MTVSVPGDVYEGLEAVRESGETNMVDMAAVQRLADERGHHATVVWLEEVDPATYFAAVIAGIVLESAVCDGCGENAAVGDPAVDGRSLCESCFEAAQLEGRR